MGKIKCIMLLMTLLIIVLCCSLMFSACGFTSGSDDLQQNGNISGNNSDNSEDNDDTSDDESESDEDTTVYIDSNGVKYKLYDNDTKYEVVGVNNPKSLSTLKIEDEINGIYVTKIAEYAFEDCENVKTVRIPETITTIENNAFLDCVNLTAVEIFDLSAWCKIIFESYSSNPLSQSGILYVNGQAIRSLNIPDGVTSIGNWAFMNCRYIESVTFPSTLRDIYANAFYGCEGITTLELPDSLKSVGDYAFYGCSSLLSVDIGEDIASIGDYTFSNCEKLVEVYISDSLTDIGDYVFADSNAIQSASIPSKAISSIPKNALKTVNILSGAIDSQAFYEYTTLENVTISEGITTIGDEAFYKCSNLSTIVIPNSITTIGKNSFNGCNIENATLPAQAISYIPKEALTGVTITSGNIAESAFSNNSTIKNITIDSGVTIIGADAFKYCSNIEKVTYTGEIEDWYSIWFYNTYSNPLYYADSFYVGYDEVSDFIVTDNVVEFYTENNLNILKIDISDYQNSGNIDNYNNPLIKDNVLLLNPTIFKKELNAVHIVGEYNTYNNLIDSLSIKFSNAWNSSFILGLENVGVYTANANGFIDISETNVTFDITLMYHGKNAIYGHNAVNNREAQTALSVDTLTLMSYYDTDSLYIKGGDGRNGTSSNGDGTDGKPAMDVDNLNIQIKGNMTITAGNGGAAYDRAAGDNNGDGCHGKDGYHGGNGAIGLITKNLQLISGKMSIVGGIGGEGGDASECNRREVLNKGDSNNVKGGRGGDAGNGNIALQADTVTIIDGSITATGGRGGDSGKRGGCHADDHEGFVMGNGTTTATDGDTGMAGSGGSGSVIKEFNGDASKLVSTDGADGTVIQELNQN